ncbi:uncharacterized protein RHO25_006632 [Cercospora beticola]|uniref:Protein kinase domain-containing protein n=1 Tax=Cercospora beticola TaxID=122368 RepID=A0ABZ0NR20_CERBT|nr:hypothetical protein RHO25_006632 [Cercospora beticola]
MTPLDFPFTLVSNCGEHEVLLKKFLQPFKFKVSSTDDEDEYYIAVFEGVYRGKLVVIKVYGSLAGCSGEQACVRAAREVRALRRLSKPSSPCPHAPQLRASFQADGSWSDRYPNDPDCQVIVMTKLPGRLIGEDILGDPDQYRRVAAAFKRALDYIIDYERAGFTELPDSCFADWLCGRASLQIEHALKGAEESSSAAGLASKGGEEASMACEPASEGVEKSSRAAKIEELQDQMAEEALHVDED